MSSNVFTNSQNYMQRARQVIPRGVSSAKRAALQPTPLAFAHAQGSRITDIDGNQYVDYVGAYGPTLLGHQPTSVMEAVHRQLSSGVLFGAQHEGEAELAERICRMVPSAEMVLLSVTGTEADQAALRIARAATQRRKIIKFEGHYHGWIDPLTVNGPGTPAGTGPVPRPIITASYNVAGSEILVCPWNDAAALTDLLAAHGTEVAAVIMEPVAVNGGNLWAAEGYLEAVRRLCNQHGSLLIFDEVITGFRLSPGGAQQRVGVTPDLTVLAKALASGFPISAVAGTRAIMSVAEDVIGHAGTYNGNAVSVAAANATLETLEAGNNTIYPTLERLSTELAQGIQLAAARYGAPVQVLRAGSIIRLHWDAPKPVRSYADSLSGKSEPLRELAEHFVRNGLHTRDNGLWYVSAAHTDADIEQTLAAVEKSFQEITAARELSTAH